MFEKLGQRAAAVLHAATSASLSSGCERVEVGHLLFALASSDEVGPLLLAHRTLRVGIPAMVEGWAELRGAVAELPYDKMGDDDPRRSGGSERSSLSGPCTRALGRAVEESKIRAARASGRARSFPSGAKLTVEPEDILLGLAWAVGDGHPAHENIPHGASLVPDYAVAVEWVENREADLERKAREAGQHERLILGRVAGVADDLMHESDVLTESLSIMRAHVGADWDQAERVATISLAKRQAAQAVQRALDEAKPLIEFLPSSGRDS